MINLTEKCIALVDKTEQTLCKTKHMSSMLRIMLKPTCTTIRSFLLIMPTEELSHTINKAHMLYESLFCYHETKQEFLDHIDELLKQWM